MAPSFKAYALGRDIQVVGARAGDAYAIFDMQGRVLRKGSVGEANFSIPLGRAGNYLVRIGRGIQRVSIR